MLGREGARRDRAAEVGAVGLVGSLARAVGLEGSLARAVGLEGSLARAAGLEGGLRRAVGRRGDLARRSALADAEWEKSEINGKFPSIHPYQAIPPPSLEASLSCMWP